MNTIQLIFTVFAAWIVGVYLLLCLWKALLGKNKKKNPIHFNDPNND